MRDLFENHEREMMMDLTGEARTVPRMLEDVPVADQDDRLRINILSPRRGLQAIDVEHAFAGLAAIHEALWDAAVAYAAQAGPMPIVGTEEWVEGDEAYRERLAQYESMMETVPSEFLDAFGEDYAIPRARLVPCHDP